MRAAADSTIIPFESEHRYMATLHHDHDGHRRAGQGGARAHARVCAEQMGPDGRAQPLDAAPGSAQIEAQARDGQRVLALARARLPAGTQDLDQRRHRAAA